MDRTDNSAMISILYTAATLKKYEYVIAANIRKPEQQQHLAAMKALQQARAKASEAAVIALIAAQADAEAKVIKAKEDLEVKKTEAIKAQAAADADQAANQEAILDKGKLARDAVIKILEAQAQVMQAQKDADAAAAILLNASANNAKAEEAARLAQYKLVSEERSGHAAAAALANARADAARAETIVLLVRKKLVAEQAQVAAALRLAGVQQQERDHKRALELLETKARLDKQAAKDAAEIRKREEEMIKAQQHRAWLITLAGLAHIAAEARKARDLKYEKLKAQDAYWRNVDFEKRKEEHRLWVPPERIRLFGEVRTNSATAGMFFMLLLLVTSGTVDVYLMWQLRPTSWSFNIKTFGKLFGALVGTAVGEEVFWFLWMWCYTAVHHSSETAWYGQKREAEPRASLHHEPASTDIFRALYFVWFTFLFLCCALPGLSTYAILVLFYWDTFVGSCAGLTCPPLVPGHSSYSLVRKKLVVQGCLRAIPSLVISTLTLVATICPSLCTPTSRCVGDIVQIQQYNFTDCFVHPGNGCDQTCFLNTKNRKAAVLAVCCTSLLLLSMLLYGMLAMCKFCCTETFEDKPPFGTSRRQEVQLAHNLIYDHPV